VLVGAALARFAADGFATPLRRIAADAEVSAALIVHHFGSKAGLRAAVDEHVLGIADEKLRLYGEGGIEQAAALVLAVMQEGHVPRYLARSIVEDGDAGARLFVSFVDVTERALPHLDVSDRRMTAALLVTHSLGAMIMATQIEAATGDHPYSSGGIMRYAAAAADIYGGAVASLVPRHLVAP
jgi:AcrR family transcriptional regulator